MAYDEVVASRVRAVLAGRRGVVEKRMFGGVAFMLRGNMCVGVIDDRLMARVGADGYESALSDDYVSAMDFTGRPLRGFVYVAPAGIAADADLEQWIERCAAFVLSLPAK